MIFSAFALVFSALAFAAPAPSAYDDPAWSDYIEHGKTATLPAGVPNGPGAVSGYHGAGFWPESYLQVTSPYDLSKADGLVFSEKAMSNRLYYGSQTMKAFLEAVVAQARKISQNSGLTIPVTSLFHAESAVPYDRAKDDVTSVSFGVFAIKDGKSEPLADLAIKNDTIRILKSYSTRKRSEFDSYQNRLVPLKTGLLNLNAMDFGKKMRELRKVVMDDAKKLENERNESRKAERLAKAKENKKDRAEKRQKNDEARTMDDRRDLKRLTAKQKSARLDEKRASGKNAAELDEAATWTLVEAILTQNAANVAEIRMPDAMRDRLVSYAKSKGKSSSVISRFEAVTVNSNSQFEVSLSCSARDRFLGCMLGGSDEIEAQVSAASSAMLKAAKNLPEGRALEVLRLVANANPVEVDEAFDTDELFKKYSDRKSDAYKLIKAIDDIPVKGQPKDKKNARKARERLPRAEVSLPI